MGKKIKNIIFIIVCVVIIAALGAVIYSSVANKDNSPPPESTTDPEIQELMDTFDELAAEDGGVEGEYDPDVSDEYMSKIDNVKSELEALGESYSAEQASDAGYVIFNGAKNENVSKIREFYEKSKNGEESELTVCYFDNEAESVLIRRVIFDGSKYYGTVDMSRYVYSSEDYLEFEYPCAELFETENPNGGFYYSLYLTEREGYSFDYVMNMSASNLASDWEKFLYICEYME